MNDNKVILHDTKVSIRDANKNGIPDDDEMQTCCSGTSDKRFGNFLIQLFITFSIVILCVYKLSLSLGCEESQLYNSLLSVVVGFWLKQIKDH